MRFRSSGFRVQDISRPNHEFTGEALSVAAHTYGFTVLTGIQIDQ